MRGAATLPSSGTWRGALVAAGAGTSFLGRPRLGPRSRFGFCFADGARRGMDLELAGAVACDAGDQGVRDGLIEGKTEAAFWPRVFRSGFDEGRVAGDGWKHADVMLEAGEPGKRALQMERRHAVSDLLGGFRDRIADGLADLCEQRADVRRLVLEIIGERCRRIRWRHWQRTFSAGGASEKQTLMALPGNAAKLSITDCFFRFCFARIRRGRLFGSRHPAVCQSSVAGGRIASTGKAS